MSPQPDLLESVIARWLADEDLAVVAAEKIDGRWAVRMIQQARDATTVWFTSGERSIQAEAYVMPSPQADREEVFRQCLVRNRRGWRVHFALDQEGAVVLVGRVARECASEHELDLLLGEFYEMIEVAFAPLVRVGFGREKTS